MKFVFSALILVVTLQAHAESFAVDGRFILGKHLLDHGQAARMSVLVDGDQIDAALVSPTSTCVFEFGRGRLEESGREKLLGDPSNYSVYLMPLLNNCRSIATDSVYLVIRRNDGGEVTSVKVMNRSRYNHWTYFTTEH